MNQRTAKPKESPERKPSRFGRDRNGKAIRPFDLVKVDFTEMPRRDRRKYPFAHGEVLLFLGQVRPMAGHLVVVNRAGQTFWGYHEEHFVKVPPREL